MLSRAELSHLMSHREYPSVSVLLPTHRTAPANKQDRIRAKNLVKQATDRLHKEFSRREVAPVLENLGSLVRDVDWEHTLDGLALFASHDHASAVQLPFRVRARVVVDETFATRDLVFTLNRTPHYRVLVLSEKPTRLYDAWKTVLDEYTASPFPMTLSPTGNSRRPRGGRGFDPSAVRDEAHRAFFRKVDEAVAKVPESDNLPLVVVGVDRHLAFFREVTRRPEAIAGMLAGSHDKTPAPALGKLVWPIFQSADTLRRSEALALLDEAVAAHRHASGVDQVWRATFEKRCRTLLVETEFEHPADVSPEGDRLLPYSGRGAAALDDAVDEIIERVLGDGGEVFFCTPGALATHQKIAAVLRF